MESISPLAGPTELRISTTISHTESDTSSSNSPSSTSSFRPQKSVLKQQGTRLQLIEQLRCFATSPQYLSICNTLATFRPSTPPSISTGTRSEPLSPITPSLSSFVLPIFPAKHQYRSRDHRRASFPKSASHPNRLNTTLTAKPLSNTATSTKQLRFSLEVQELVFLPTSPPFRISRAKPTRAHSDPAIQTSTSSSFMAPSHPLPSLHGPSRDRNLISTATASGKESTTTFIKIQDRSSSSSRSRGYGVTDDYEEEDELGISFDDDDYLFQECVEDNERHQFLPAKDVVVARRVQDEQHPRRIGPGVLWQVYTAVTGVKELIAWYGSMVYHSSSL
ncbi:hypothetical protein BGZ82_007038 [Podila clonocystis]|nr:hypothetical protein BGZ82_007038 [Podila clonocystis]